MGDSLPLPSAVRTTGGAASPRSFALSKNGFFPQILPIWCTDLLAVGGCPLLFCFPSPTQWAMAEMGNYQVWLREKNGRGMFFMGLNLAQMQEKLGNLPCFGGNLR